jgi:putative peptidoglycan lipid II flippase
MKHISKSAFRFSLGTLFSRISGMAREMTMAFVLGTTPAAAAFLIAFRFAYLLRRLFGESALVNGFIPHYQAMRSKDEKGAANFFGDLFATMSILLIGLIGILEILLFIFLHYFPIQESNAEILRLIMLSLPGLLFICLFALHCGFLQCHGRGLDRDACRFPTPGPFFNHFASCNSTRCCIPISMGRFAACNLEKTQRCSDHMAF